MMSFLDFSSYDVDTWLTFLGENWIVIAIALVVLLLIIKVVKTMVKWAFVLIIVIGLIFYSGYTLDDVKSISSNIMSGSMDELKEIGTKVADNVKQEAINAMIGEAKEAEYEVHEDGTYTVITKSVTLTGEIGKDEVSVSLKGAPAFKVQMNETLSSFIEQAQKNSK